MNKNPAHEQQLLFDLSPSKEKEPGELEENSDKHVNKKDVIGFIVSILKKYQKPSALELLEQVESELGLQSLLYIHSALNDLANSNKLDFDLTAFDREYCRSLIKDGSLEKAHKANIGVKNEIISSIDSLFAQSNEYRSSNAFQEMIEFMGNFRDYAPYNNMLVRIQNPSCSFYATANDWKGRFDRDIKEDARPMIILAPMHPVMLVYDLDQTVGEKLPDELMKFSKFSGSWDSKLITRLIENANRHNIRIDFKELSSTNSGFATIARGSGDWKMRVAIHDKLDEPSRYGVLCHELAHIFLGHLGSDSDYWWLSRLNLEHSTIEIEAEAVAYIVTTRLELSGASSTYVSRHLKNGETIPESVSIDLIAKVAKKIETMSLQYVKQPNKKKLE